MKVLAIPLTSLLRSINSYAEAYAVSVTDMKKIISILFLLFILSTVRFFTVHAEEQVDMPGNLIQGAVSGILIEQSTGEILYKKEIDKRLSPASMTKIMTLLLIYEAMESQAFTKDTILTTSETASGMGGSQVYLKVGEKISVDEALKCVCIASANDCAVLLAEEVAGSEDYFVRKMNEKAKELGCKNTNFSDCTGLTSKDHYTSAYDMALMAKELLTKYPDVLTYTTIKEDYIRKDTSSPFWLVNTNKMIGRVEGLNGLKTGYTSFSGYCITLSMQKEGMNLISVVFGYDKATTRNAESLELLKYGFSTYKLETILKKDTILESVDHILYKNKIDVVVGEDIRYLCKKTDKNDYDFRYEYTIGKDSCEGTVRIYLKDKLIQEGRITSKTPVERKNIFELAMGVIQNCFA